MVTQQTQREKTVLVITWGHFLAHTARALQIAKELRPLGHRIIFAMVGYSAEFVRQAGFEVRPVIELDPSVIFRGGRYTGDLHSTAESVERFVKEEEALIREVKPDLVVHGALRFTASMSADVARVPHMCLHDAYYFSGCDNQIRVMEEEGASDEEWEREDQRLLEPYNQVRRKYGLPMVKHFLDNFIADVNLFPDVPEYAPMRSSSKNFVFHYVGPIEWEPEVPLPDWVNELSPDRPAIYFTMGGSGSPQFFEQVANSFANTEYQLVITTGGQIDPARLRAAAPNIYAENFLPGTEMLKRSDAIVYHGGSGTAYQAMTEGLPLIAFPLNIDQRWNANRIAELGLGVRINDLDPKTIRRAIDEVLTNPVYKANVARFQKILPRYRGAKDAARIIDAYLT